MAEIKPLDYSPPDARSNRAWFGVKVAAGVLVFLFASAVLCDLAEPFWQRFQMLSAQRRCLTFSQAPGTVVYEENPTAAAMLAGGKIMGAGWSTLSTTGRPGGAILGYSATAPEFFRQIAFPGLGLVDDRQAFFSRWGFGGVDNFIYLGGRSPATGPERLIYLELNSIFALRQGNPQRFAPATTDEHVLINWFVMQPATLSSPLKILQSGSWGERNFWINMPWPMRIYAGQRDSNDSSRIIIPYRIPDGAFAVDVQLQANDQLTFTRREASRFDGPMP